MAFVHHAADRDMSIDAAIGNLPAELREWGVAFHRRHPSLGLAACTGIVVALLASAIPADTRLLILCTGLFAVGAGGLAWHGKQKWDRFCDQIAIQSRTMPWRNFMY